MTPPAAGKIFLGVIGVALVLVAAAFLGLAIYMLFRSSLSVSAAAAATSGILLITPAFWALWKQLRPPPPRQSANAQAASLVVLANLSRKSPLLALLGAALLGVGEYLLRR